MELLLQRFAEAQDYTYGVLFEKGLKYPECFTIEDEGREVKVKGETRIPAGRYEIKFRKVESGMTTKYKNKYPWFTWHLELQDVPNFQYVYIHIGNTDDHTDGCILLGDTCDLTTGKDGFIGESTPAYERFYKKASKAINAGERVFIVILDLK